MVKEYYKKERSEVLIFIPIKARNILEIGCGAGTFSEQVKSRQDAEIWGIELDFDSAKIAKSVLDKIFVDDVFNVVDEIPDHQFDCIICNDVLEHIIDPYSLVSKLLKKLTVEGVLVASIPNVRYFKVLYHLNFSKRWDYKDWGVLDRTHLRFFTYKNIRELFENQGYEIVSINGINPTKSPYFKIINLLTLGHYWDSRYIQFVCVAKAKSNE